MGSLNSHRLISILMSAVLVIQMAAPAIVAAANPGRVDLFSIICASSGNLSSEAVSSIEEFLALTEGDEPQSVHHSADCVGCCSVKASPPVAQLKTAGASLFAYALHYSYVDAHLHRILSGAPLGVRAPPFLLT